MLTRSFSFLFFLAIWPSSNFDACLEECYILGPKLTVWFGESDGLMILNCRSFLGGSFSNLLIHFCDTIRTEWTILFLFFFRCRKDMKRVERRGSLENQQQQVANQSVQQQQQEHQPQFNSHSNLPLSQGSDHSVHRSDTILTHQQSHSPSSFLQSHNPWSRYLIITYPI